MFWIWPKLWYCAGPKNQWLRVRLSLNGSTNLNLISVYVHRAAVLSTNTSRSVRMSQNVDSARKSYTAFDQPDRVNVPVSQSARKPYVVHMVAFCVINVCANELSEHFWSRNRKLLKCLRMPKHQSRPKQLRQSNLVLWQMKILIKTKITVKKSEPNV